MKQAGKVWLLGVVLLWSGGLAASDLEKEQRWAEQVVGDLFDGEAVWPQAGGRNFLALFTAAEGGTSQGNVLVLHGVGAHPDWPQVINPLRVSLAERGWNTLSLQLPVLANEAAVEDYLPLFDEADARIDEGIAYLRDCCEGPVFIVAHSLGAAMASWYLAAHPDSVIQGFVGVGMNTSDYDKLNNAASLAKIRLPVLDLFGERDLEGVLAGAGARNSAAAIAGNDAYTRQTIAGADHFFEGKEAELLDAVAAWLGSVAMR
ncbi:MAG: DUF3530 family protein [Pseudomonadota bacterium]|nr:DUF3530 family protein [Pseudomonadota bacterium]